MQEMRLQGSEAEGEDVPRGLNTTFFLYFFAFSMNIFYIPCLTANRKLFIRMNGI